MLKRCIHSFPFIVVFVFLCILLVITTGASGSKRIWENYYVIGIPEKEYSEVIKSDLFDDFDIVSENNTFFEYNDFSSKKTINLSELSSRFIDGDPRVDPYMKGAKKYFHTFSEDGSPIILVYVKTTMPRLKFYNKIKRSWAGSVSDWYFPDINIFHNIFSALLFGLCWFFGTWLSEKQRIPSSIAGLPWFIAVLVNGAVILPAAAAIYVFLMLTLREFSKDLIFYFNYKKLELSDTLKSYLISIGTIVIIEIVYGIVKNDTSISLLISLAADFVCFFVFYFLRGHIVQMQEHQIFFPVSILTSAPVEKNTKKITEILLSAAIIAFIPLFVLFFKSNMSVSIPVPDDSLNLKEWTWENLEYIDGNLSGELVDATDLIKHKAYQDGFLYGRDWIFPEPDEKIMEKVYSHSGKDIETKEICVFQFTEQWYCNIISSLSDRAGISSLLLSQSSPGSVLIRSAKINKPRFLNLIESIVVGVVAVLPMLWQFVIGFGFINRRKGQEA
ncbi:MAG: hypothetical protein PQJ46_01325 [Spirochaetales bacterium]|nr:hypothetical protein [Spirochaetales bacterium]